MNKLGKLKQCFNFSVLFLSVTSFCQVAQAQYNVPIQPPVPNHDTMFPRRVRAPNSPPSVNIPSLRNTQGRVFTLLNRTSSPLIRFYASPSGARNWEADIMNGSVLRPGQSVRVTIADGRQTCLYDIRGDFADGDKVEDYKVNICSIDTYRFFEQ
jgi:hypothetical protein